jgi:hypothetical protein
LSRMKPKTTRPANVAAINRNCSSRVIIFSFFLLRCPHTRIRRR